MFSKMLDIEFRSSPSFDVSKSFAVNSDRFDFSRVSLLLEIFEVMLLNASSTNRELSFDLAQTSTALKIMIIILLIIFSNKLTAYALFSSLHIQ